MPYMPGQFDNTIAAPNAPITPNRQPPNIQTLTQISGKSPNSVKVEFEKKMRELNDEQMKNPPNQMDTETSPLAQNRIAAFNDLKDEYINGAESEETDEDIYNDILGNVATDMGQDPNAMDFNMFVPGEQDMADQMFSDIDEINEETPMPNDEADTEPLSMDELGKLAEPDDGVDESFDDNDIPELPEE